MCLNCGCQQYNDNLGNPKNLVWKQVEEAAKANGMSLADTVKELTNGMQAMLKQGQKK